MVVPGATAEHYSTSQFEHWPAVAADGACLPFQATAALWIVSTNLRRLTPYPGFPNLFTRPRRPPEPPMIPPGHQTWLINDSALCCEMRMRIYIMTLWRSILAAWSYRLSPRRPLSVFTQCRDCMAVACASEPATLDQDLDWSICL